MMCTSILQLAEQPPLFPLSKDSEVNLIASPQIPKFLEGPPTLNWLKYYHSIMVGTKLI